MGRANALSVFTGNVVKLTLGLAACMLNMRSEEKHMVFDSYFARFMNT